MGTKRVGMARVKSLINENVNQLKLNSQKQIVLKVGSAHANHIVTQTDDVIYGRATVISTTDDKTAVQVVAAAGGQDKIKLNASSATLGGNSGDTIELYCYEDGYWTCEANLVTTNANPGSIAVIDD